MIIILPIGLALAVVIIYSIITSNSSPTPEDAYPNPLPSSAELNEHIF